MFIVSHSFLRFHPLELCNSSSSVSITERNSCLVGFCKTKIVTFFVSSKIPQDNLFFLLPYLCLVCLYVDVSQYTYVIHLTSFHCFFYLCLQGKNAQNNITVKSAVQACWFACSHQAKQYKAWFSYVADGQQLIVGRDIFKSFSLLPFFTRRLTFRGGCRMLKYFVFRGWFFFETLKSLDRRK